MTNPITMDASEPIVSSLSDVPDSLVHTALARLTCGLSPVAGLLAWHDWAIHLAISPGKQRSLLDKALDKQRRLAQYARHATAMSHCSNCIEPLEQDRRFADPAWQQ